MLINLKVDTQRFQLVTNGNHLRFQQMSTTFGLKTLPSKINGGDKTFQEKTLNVNICFCESLLEEASMFLNQKLQIALPVDRAETAQACVKTRNSEPPSSLQ